MNNHQIAQQLWQLATAFLLWLAIVSAPRAASAQPLTYGAVDRATVRVFSIKRAVDTQLLPSRGGSERTVAVPVVSHGSGVLVRKDGLVLTAHHVAAAASVLGVQLPGTDEVLPARVVYTDPVLDFAFLSVPGRFDNHAKLAKPTKRLRVRQPVHAVGYPIDPALEQPLSSPGVIAGALSDGNVQLGMSLNPGNSGGPLIDQDEKVVGIVIARGDPNKGVLGLGVALPIEPALHVLRTSKQLAARHAKTAWTKEERELAGLAGALAQAGPIGFITQVADQLHSAHGNRMPVALEAVASREHNPDLLALSAAYLWNAVVVMVEDAGGKLDIDALPERVRVRAGRYLRKAIALCHTAIEEDPGVYGRSEFVEHVIDQWPEVPSAEGSLRFVSLPPVAHPAAVQAQRFNRSAAYAVDETETWIELATRGR